jgi:hypothetical protein
LVDETGVPGENYRPATRHWQTLSHNVNRTSNAVPRKSLLCLTVYSEIQSTTASPKGFSLDRFHCRCLFDLSDTLILSDNIQKFFCFIILAKNILLQYNFFSL